MKINSRKVKTESGDEIIEWNAGDVFVTPVDESQTHYAIDEPAVLWIVTNEPQLAFEKLQALMAGKAPTDVVHYPSKEIDKQIDLIYRVGRGDDIAGSALIFCIQQTGG